MPRLERLCGHPLYKREMQALEIYERGREFCRHGWDHLLDVARIAYILVLEQQLDIPKDVVYGMAFIHDIGRAAQYRDGTDHALAGKRLAQQIQPVTVLRKPVGYVGQWPGTGPPKRQMACRQK